MLTFTKRVNTFSSSSWFCCFSKLISISIFGRSSFWTLDGRQLNMSHFKSQDNCLFEDFNQDKTVKVLRVRLSIEVINYHQSALRQRDLIHYFAALNISQTLWSTSTQPSEILKSSQFCWQKYFADLKHKMCKFKSKACKNCKLQTLLKYSGWEIFSSGGWADTAETR